MEKASSRVRPASCQTDSTDARGDDRKVATPKPIERRKITPALRFLWFAAFTAGWAGLSGPARSLRWRRLVRQLCALLPADRRASAWHRPKLSACRRSAAYIG